MELLKLYAHEPSDEELRDIQQLLAQYYANKAHAAMDAFIAEQEATPEEIYATWASEHLRTPYTTNRLSHANSD
jgi:hypothetical protein